MIPLIVRCQSSACIHITLHNRIHIYTRYTWKLRSEQGRSRTFCSRIDDKSQKTPTQRILIAQTSDLLKQLGGPSSQQQLIMDQISGSILLSCYFLHNNNNICTCRCLWLLPRNLIFILMSLFYT